MTDDLLFAIDLADPSGEFEPASELLNALEMEFSSFFDRENCTVRHTVYALTEEEAQENKVRLIDALVQWKEFGVELEMGDIFTIAKSDWSEAWKKYLINCLSGLHGLTMLPKRDRKFCRSIPE